MATRPWSTFVSLSLPIHVFEMSTLTPDNGVVGHTTFEDGSVVEWQQIETVEVFVGHTTCEDGSVIEWRHIEIVEVNTTNTSTLRALHRPCLSRQISYLSLGSPAIPLKESSCRDSRLGVQSRDILSLGPPAIPLNGSDANNSPLCSSFDHDVYSVPALTRSPSSRASSSGPPEPIHVGTGLSEDEYAISRLQVIEGIPQPGYVSPPFHPYSRQWQPTLDLAGAVPFEQMGWSDVEPEDR